MHVLLYSAKDQPYITTQFTRASTVTSHVSVVNQFTKRPKFDNYVCFKMLNTLVAITGRFGNCLQHLVAIVFLINHQMENPCS